MIYQLPLWVTGLAAGLLLASTHAAALAAPARSISLARAFPRCRVAATVLTAAAAVWAFLLVRDIDLGEFSPLRNILLLSIAAGAVLSWIFLPEFLAVRSLGILLLLMAEPALESAVLRTEPSRLLLVVLAYAWAVAGLFLVGMPYLLRDAIAWASRSPARWRAAAAAGLACGLALSACSLALWR